MPHPIAKYFLPIRAFFQLWRRGRFGFLIILLAGVDQGLAGNPSEHWVGTWGTSPQLTELKNLPPPPGLSSNTLRQVVHVSLGGDKLRIRFSNAFGNGPLEIIAAHLALAAGAGAVDPASDRTLAFAGKPTVTIPAGGAVWSDPIEFRAGALSDLVVSLHFGKVPTDITGHPGSRATSYLESDDAVKAAQMSGAATTQHWYVLTGVDVDRPDASAAIVTLGDSITDGRGSEPDRNNRWPDDLAARLQTNSATANLAVLNQGIGGNCVLRGGLGPTATSRYDRDVLEQSAARWVIVLEGVNDIGGSRGTNTAVAQRLIEAYQKMIDLAHAKKMRIYGATILPFGQSFYDSPAHETARQTVNEWIRTSGRFDGVIDFDAVTRDPAKPTHLLSAADSGDHLHPSVRGYQMMADAIDLALFEK